jgi:dihydropteroate synthase
VFELPIGRIAIMGVINVTPDSFSDGGAYQDHDAAIAAGLRMVEDGADLVDVGGESTRPGAAPVSLDEELSRVGKVVEELRRAGVAVSIDTSKHEVAHACLKLGALVVNDVTALRDPTMAEVCAEAGCTVCLMHMQGEPRTMQENPVYVDVVKDVATALSSSVEFAIKAGVKRERIWLDPGIGFGKTVEHNLRLLAHLDQIASLGYPVLVGVSRKSFIGRLVGQEGRPAPMEHRLEGSIAAQVLAQAKGARILRVHDVAQARRAAQVADAILQSD